MSTQGLGQDPRSHYSSARSFGTSLVEVKDWYVTDRQKGIRDLRYLDKDGRLRHTHSHYYQIQTALLVSGMKSCYFVVHGEESRIEVIEFD